MELSARNQVAGTITNIELGAVMADVVLDIGGGQALTSAITRPSLGPLGSRVGDKVLAINKATDVMFD